MPRAKATTRLYKRGTRFYGDFRDYRDVGGGQEALKAPGMRRATDDRAIAEALLTARLAELQRLRRDRAMVGEPIKGIALAELARVHLIRKAEAGKQSERWLLSAEQHLGRACEFFGASRRLSTIGVEDVHNWITKLERTPSKKGGTLMAGTVRHHLNSLSSLYRRAQSLGLVPPGFNPVSAMMPGELPVGRRAEAEWLEVHEAAVLLELARVTPRASNGVPFLYPLVATLLLTGGRKSEVAGLTVDDVSFDRMTVTFRPNRHRASLKNRGSHRVVPLWPQLAEILRPYIFPLDRTPREGLLFPTLSAAGELVPVSNYDKQLDHVAARAGWNAGVVRSHGLRHSWASARLQTLDRGQPIPLYTVQQEGGWSSDEMLRRIYGHLGTIRHRAEVVEFRLEQHEEAIRARFGPTVTRILLQSRKAERQRVG